MAEIVWTPYDTQVSYLTTDLNALANNANVLGAAIDFAAVGVDRKQYMDVELYLAQADWSAQTSLAVYLWLLSRTDGTNFEDGAAGTDPARIPDAIIAIRAANAAQRLFARFILTTPDQGKILVGNRTGANFAATGNTLKYYTYSESVSE